MTLGDLKSTPSSGPGHMSDDSDNDDKQDMFAGGEKSYVQRPAARGNNETYTIFIVALQSKILTRAPKVTRTV